MTWRKVDKAVFGGICALALTGMFGTGLRAGELRADDGHGKRGEAGCLRAPPDLPAAVSPPASECPTSLLFGVGVQVYACASGAWSLLAPEANLTETEDGRFAGNHFLGPAWQARDGSKVHAVKAASAPAPDAARDVPWLLLNVTERSGAGRFGQVTHVVRAFTRGGVSPAGACAPEGSQVRVPYDATYLFYGPR